MIRAMALAALALLPAASASAEAKLTAVRGEFLKTGEAIHGLLSEEDGKGTLQAQLSTLVACTGTYEAVAGAGEGRISCSDNRTGEFSFVRAGDGGIGCGVLQPGTGFFRLVIGETVFLPGYPQGLSCGR